MDTHQGNLKTQFLSVSPIHQRQPPASAQHFCDSHPMPPPMTAPHPSCGLVPKPIESPTQPSKPCPLLEPSIEFKASFIHPPIPLPSLPSNPCLELVASTPLPSSQPLPQTKTTFDTPMVQHTISDTISDPMVLDIVPNNTSAQCTILEQTEGYINFISPYVKSPQQRRVYGDITSSGPAINLPRRVTGLHSMVWMVDLYLGRPTPISVIPEDPTLGRMFGFSSPTHFQETGVLCQHP